MGRGAAQENQHYLPWRRWESNSIPIPAWKNGIEGLPGRNLLEGNYSGIDVTFYPAGEGGWAHLSLGVPMVDLGQGSGIQGWEYSWNVQLGQFGWFHPLKQTWKMREMWKPSRDGREGKKSVGKILIPVKCKIFLFFKVCANSGWLQNSPISSFGFDSFKKTGRGKLTAPLLPLGRKTNKIHFFGSRFSTYWRFPLKKLINDGINSRISFGIVFLKYKSGL